MATVGNPVPATDLEIEVLLAYGATRRACAQLRERKGVTTVAMVGSLVDGYRKAWRQYPRGGYRFHTFLKCDHVGRESGDALLQAYERWERANVRRRNWLNEPDLVMV